MSYPRYERRPRAPSMKVMLVGPATTSSRPFDKRRAHPIGRNLSLLVETRGHGARGRLRTREAALSRSSTDYRDLQDSQREPLRFPNLFRSNGPNDVEQGRGDEAAPASGAERL